MNNNAKRYANWLTSAAVKRQLAAEQQAFVHVLDDVRGVRLLFAGASEDTDFLSASHVAFTTRMGLSPWQQGVVEADLWSTDVCWPFPDNSLDVVVLQHALEMSLAPHTMIKEACRVITPGGHLLVAGFNPFSVWGGVRQLNRWRSERLWFPSPIGASRLHDWLTLLDFYSIKRVSFTALWPLNERIESGIGRYITSPWAPSSAYLLKARKTVAGSISGKKRRWQFVNRRYATPAYRTRA